MEISGIMADKNSVGEWTYFHVMIHVGKDVVCFYKASIIMKQSDVYRICNNQSRII